MDCETEACQRDESLELGHYSLISADSDRLDEALRCGVDTAGLPGVVALLGDRDGVTYATAVGRRGVDSEEPMTLDTLFWLASMTKGVTATAAMQLVEGGMLELDAPIGAVLPQLSSPQVIEGFGDLHAPRLRPAKRPITLRHLLTHTAGIGLDWVSADQLRARGPGGAPPYTSLDWLRVPLLFDPGERWEYGMNSDWVGLAVEAVSGQTLDAYFVEHIFKPLGMTDTTFRVSADRRARLATVQCRSERGQSSVVPSLGAAWAEGEFLSGGAGLTGTGPDYLRFLRMLLNGGILEGERVLTPESVTLMSTNQVGALRAGRITSAMPDLAVPFDRFPTLRTGWSLGFLLNAQDDPAGGRSAGSFGWAGLANTHFWVDPASNVAGVFLAQLLPFGDPSATELAIAFERQAYAGQIGTERRVDVP